MNLNKIEKQLDHAWLKAGMAGGETRVFFPGEIDPTDSAQILVSLLSTLYTQHDISKDPSKVLSDILVGKVEPWIVSRNGKPVACTALVEQEKGVVELGRAASIERGVGAGQIAMLMAAKNKGNNSLVAEVRLADEFADIPSGESTQRICFGILDLVPHAIIPAFAHGSPKRREMFAFSTEHGVTINDSPLLTAKDAIKNRDLSGTNKKFKVINENPFRIAIPAEEGMDILDFESFARCENAGCTLIPVESTDANLPTINALMRGEFTLAGVDRNVGESGKPILLFATVGRGTLIAPTKLTSHLPTNTQKDVMSIDRSFAKLSGAR